MHVEGGEQAYGTNNLKQMAEVTNADLKAINQGKMADWDETQMPASLFPSMTPDEYKGVMEGTITEPGEYEIRDGDLYKKGWFGYSIV